MTITFRSTKRIVWDSTDFIRLASTTFSKDNFPLGLKYNVHNELFINKIDLQIHTRALLTLNG